MLRFNRIWLFFLFSFTLGGCDYLRPPKVFKAPEGAITKKTMAHKMNLFILDQSTHEEATDYCVKLGA